MANEKKYLLVLFVLLLFSCNSDDNLVANPSPSNSEKLFGIHAFSLSEGNSVQKLNILRELGVEIVRIPFSWHLFEPDEKGVTPDFFWNFIDAELIAAEQVGVKVILEMGLTPCWASSDPMADCTDPNYTGYLNYPPTDIQDYADAIGRMAERYGNRVYAYEIGNEPNLQGNWLPYGPRETDNDDYGSFIDLDAAQEYAGVLIAAYSKIKEVDENILVVAGAIAGCDEAYLQTLYDAGISGNYDAVSIHPYTDVYPVEATDPNYGKSYGPDYCPSSGAPQFWCIEKGVENMRAVMERNNDSSPLWFTEFGFSSTTGWNGSGEQKQSEQLGQILELIKKWDFVEVACWYNLIDLGTEEDREAKFGLYDTGLNAKPAADIYRNVIK